MNWIRTTLICLFALVGAVAATAQTRTGKVYTIAERAPEFPGGKAALSRYLAQNIRYPNALLRKNVSTGPVSARFIIDETGQVSDVRVLTKALGTANRKGMEEYMGTIISAVEKMPRWQPGLVDNRPVPVFYTLPIEISMK
jgi:protein TonB